MRLLPILSGCLVAFGVTALFAADPVPRKIDFNREVRPILSENCFVCHGPDAKALKGDLRLDVKGDVFRDRDGLKAVVPGKPDESVLYERLISTEPTEQMPPPEAGKKLTPQEIETVRQWIAQGAEWKDHWAYVKPDKPAVPAIDEPGFVRNDIDRFILAALREKGLSHVAEADRVTLIRRLSFDLTGLPPTPAEVAAFATDPTLAAYDKVVDRLLSSPHYGERMAMYWLDVVRYADTIGIHSDVHRNMDLYRDYVIRSFNENRPFDEFTLEQLAGDLLPNSTSQQRVASGYNRLLMTTNEGGAQPKEYLTKYSADRVRNAASAWLGSTLGCAECHDHKFDPFATRDFYRFAAFFADVQETPVGDQPETALPTPDEEQQFASLEAAAAPLRTILDTSTPELEAAQSEWEKQTLATLPTQQAWSPLKPASVTSSGKATLAVQDDLSVLSGGENPDKDNYTVTLSTERSNITGIRLEALTHSSLANGSLSRGNGNFVLTEVIVEAATGDAKPQAVKLVKALADFEQTGHPVAQAIDGKPATGWAINGHVKAEDHKAVFVFEKPLAGGPGTTLTIQLKHESQYAKHNIGRFRLAVTSQEQPGLSDSGLPDEIVSSLKADPGKRTDAQKAALAKYYRGIAPALAGPRRQLAEVDAQIDALKKSFRKTLVTVSVAPRMIRVLPRGNWLDESGEAVEPGVPGFLQQIESVNRANRLDLAKWLVSRGNPLTARVFVNRLWKLCFGQGIVKSLDDFGSQGTAPTHPELLDWLATDFVEHGWDVKRTMRLLVTSGTYRLSSLPGETLKQKDPYNQWLARQARYRMDAELVRDNALSISGMLATHLYGRSVRPYQPPGYWAHLNFPQREYQVDTGENLYRRGLYTYWCRTFLHPSFVAFDAPSREESCVDRPRSNTPLQALVLLNDPIYVEAARGFAERLLKEGGPDAASKIKHAFQLALSRDPRPDELQVLQPLYEKHRQQYLADTKARDALLAVGPRPIPADADRTELAAWTSVARVILNLHETITRY